jgi:hypothetical protein
MSGWDEEKYKELQDKLNHCKLYGQSDLYDQSLLLMAAYLIGVMDALLDVAGEDDIKELEVSDDIYV